MNCDYFRLHNRLFISSCNCKGAMTYNWENAHDCTLGRSNTARMLRKHTNAHKNHLKWERAIVFGDKSF